MPFSNSGQYALPASYKAAPRTPIMSEQHNQPLEDIRQALSETLLADGRKAMTGPLILSGDATEDFHAPPKSQVEQIASDAVTGIGTVAGRALLNAADVAAQKTALGLNNVDNTSDINKPLSAAMTAALDALTIDYAPFYPDEPTGRAAVADGKYFRVPGSGDVAAYLYRRINSTTSELKSTFAGPGTVEPSYSLFPDSFFRTSTAAGKTLTISGKDFLPTNLAVHAYRTWVPNFVHAFGLGAYEITPNGQYVPFSVWFNTPAALQAAPTTGGAMTVGAIVVAPSGIGYEIRARFFDANGTAIGSAAGLASFAGTGGMQIAPSAPVTIPAGAAGVEVLVTCSSAAVYVLDVDATPGNTFAALARYKLGNAVGARLAEIDRLENDAIAYGSQIEDRVTYTAVSDLTSMTSGQRVARTEASGFIGYGQVFDTPATITRNAVYLAEVQRPAMATNARRWDFISVEVRTHATDPTSAAATVVAVGEIAVPREVHLLSGVIVPLLSPTNGKPTSFTQANLLAKYGIFYTVRSQYGPSFTGEIYGTINAADGTKTQSYYKTLASGWLPLSGNPTLAIGLCSLTTPGVTRTFPPSGMQKLLAGPNRRNLGALRTVNQKLMTYALNGGSLRLTMANIGDSWSTEPVYYSSVLANYASLKLGDGGVGLFGLGFLGSIATPTGNAKGAYYVKSFTGTWTSNYHAGSTSPTISDARASSGATLVIGSGTASYRPPLSAVKLYYTGTADGVIKWRWNDGAWSSDTTVQGGVGVQQVLDLTSFPSGTITYDALDKVKLEIQVVSGSVILCAIDFQSNTSGFVLHKCGSSGSKASDWLTSNETNWNMGLASLSPDLVTIMLGVNDASAGVGTDTFAHQLGQLVRRIRTAKPTVDIMIVAQPETPLPYASRITPYSAAALEIADRLKCAFLWLQPLFGAHDNPNGYAYASSHPMYFSDDTHPVDGAAKSIAKEMAECLFDV